MAELISSGYRHGNSFLHRLDGRFKLLFLILISISSLKTEFSGLFVISVFASILIFNIRIPFISVVVELRYLFIFLLFVFIVRAVSTPGTPLFEFMQLEITIQGISDGALTCWRLALVALSGLIVVLTTRLAAISSAVGWMMSPIPFIPEKRVGTMISLRFRFLPVILEQTKEVSDAQRARGVENKKNPVYRLKRLSIPVFRKTFTNADNLAVAMAARCYSDNRTGYELSSNSSDWTALAVVCCLCAVVVYCF